jgi:hypothetical protein
MEMSLLKIGKSVPKPVAMTTMVALRQIAENDPLAFYELVELCKDSNHQIWGDTDKLKGLSLLQSDGRVRDDVKEVILSAAEGEGMELSLGSPFAGC